MLVVDASVTLEWFLPGTMSTVATKARQIGKRSRLVVPSLWSFETHNVVLKLLRKGHLTIDEAMNIRIELSLLSKRIERFEEGDRIDRTWEIANRHMATFYDAAYVELAWRLGLPLATTDSGMRTAAAAVGVKLI